MINRCPLCRHNQVKPSPAYRITISTSTSIKMDSPEFISTIHQRIKDGFYTLDNIKPME